MATQVQNGQLVSVPAGTPTPTGLPGISTDPSGQFVSVPTSGGGGGVRGPGSEHEAQIIAERKRVAEQIAKAEEAARQAEIQRQREIREAQEAAAKAAEEQKRQELITTRAKRVSEAEMKARDLGLLPGDTLSLVRLQEAREIKQAGQTARLNVGATGTVTTAPTRTVVGVARDIPEKITQFTTRERDVRNIIPEKVFADNERFRISLSPEEKGKPTREIIAGRFGEVGIGVAQAGIGIAETGGQLFSLLGSQTFEFDESGNRVAAKKFKFGGKIGKIRDAPTTTGTILGQSLIIAPLAGAGVASFTTSISNVGTVQTLQDTIGSVSPFKIQSGTFGALEGKSLLTDLKFEAISVKTAKGGVTSRVLVGRTPADSPEAFILSKQVSRGVGSKEFGLAITDVTAPTTTFRSGTFTEGLRTIRTQSVFTGQGGSPSITTPGLKIALEGLRGTGGTVASRTILDLAVTDDAAQLVFQPVGKFDTSSVGGVSVKKEGFDLFAAGEGRRVLRIGRTGGQELVKVKKINLKGIEVDLSKIGGDSIGSVSTGPVKTITTTTTPISPPTPKPTPVTAPATSFAPILKLDTGKLDSSIIKTDTTSLNELSISQVSANKVIVSPRISVSTIVGARQSQSILQTPKQRDKIKVVTTTKSISDTLQNSKQRQLSDTKQLQQQKQKGVQKLVLPQFPITPILRTKKTIEPFKINLNFKPKKQPRVKTPIFSVQVRRGGKFTTIGQTKDLTKALSIGRERVGSTLAATFRIQGLTNGGLPTLEGFRKKGDKKEGLLFIEKRGKRLSKRGETKEIQRAKKAKKKKRRKKK